MITSVLAHGPEAHIAAYPVPNAHLVNAIQVSISASDGLDVGMAETVEETRTDLDSHANMCVFGKHCMIINDSGRYADVNGFSQELDSLRKVPIVDAAIAYDCPFSLKSYILVARNVLYVQSMTHNLIPPFIMREAGVQVNEVAKIHAKNPSVEDHSIYFEDEQLRIPLALWGIFSYFPTRKPVEDDNELSDTLLITPDSPDWNPHSDVFARNEESFLDWRGDIVQPRHRNTILLDDSDAQAFISSLTASTSSEFSHEENNMIDRIIMEALVMGAESTTPFNISSTLADVSSTLDPSTFASDLFERAALSKYGMSIGATHGTLHEDDDLFVTEAGATHASQPKGVTAKELSKLWRIDHDTAVRTLEVTTQRKKQDGHSSLSRNFTTNDRMLRYRRINSFFFTDTFFVTAKARSSRGNKCMQIFVSDKGFVYVVPMKSKSEFADALRMFAKEIGVPEALIVDPSGEQTSRKVKSFCHQAGVTLRILEEGTQWANRAELYVGLMKEAVRKDLRESNCPLVFWDYCAERRARIHNLTAKDLFQLQGQNPHSVTLGDEGDISNLCLFGWYEWCYFRDQSESFPMPKEKLGRVLGPARNEGNEMSQWILNSNGRIVPRRSLRKLTPGELNPTNADEARKREIFASATSDKFGDSMSPPPEPLSDKDFVPYEDDEVEPLTMPESDPLDANGCPISEQPYFDRLIHAELTLPQGEELQNARVVGRHKDSDGNVVGTFNENPILNTIVYDVEFPDGAVRQYAANIIAENMYSQVDSEGFQYELLDSIIDCAKDGNALEKGQEYVVTKRGRQRISHTTAGWKLLVLWKGGGEQWIPLKDLKESNPVEVAEFAKSRGIDDEPAFKWWVPYTLKKRDRIIAAIDSRVRNTTHKYGIEIPRTVQEAKKLDVKNNNTLWEDAIKKEMYNVSIAFDILEEGKSAPPGWMKSSGHIIFDVKMDFTRKARWVKDGHKTPDPDWSTYAGFVSRDSVRIALTYAALNDLDIFAADIKNAYLQAPSSEKHYIICGLEFGLENVGKVALIKRALYGGKSAGRDFWEHLRNCMEFLGFTSCKADPDVWMRAAVKSDGTEYYEYVLLYCDDTLVISENGESILRNEIGKYFELKEESIGPPSIYLGGKLSKVTLDNGIEAWSFSSSQYVQAAVDNVETHLKRSDRTLKAKATAPMTSNYRPETDVTPELGASEASYYMSLIGVLRWIVELGRVDIAVEVSLLSSHMALPREGHLEQVLHIFAYLKVHHNAELVFDPSYPEIDQSLFQPQDWSSTVYGDKLEEDLPPNMPKPLGNAMKMTAYVDSDHAGDTITRRSRTGFLVYLNCSLIFWLSKKQASIETSSFGAEFTAMKQCTEYVRGLRYKLRMMGIPCEEPTYIYGDNKSVLANTSVPHSVLKKKSNSIAYHFVREGCARKEWITTYVNTHFNPADLLTKPLPAGEKRRRFVSMLLYHIYPGD